MPLFPSSRLALFYAVVLLFTSQTLARPHDIDVPDATQTGWAAGHWTGRPQPYPHWWSVYPGHSQGVSSTSSVSVVATAVASTSAGGVSSSKVSGSAASVSVSTSISGSASASSATASFLSASAASSASVSASSAAATSTALPIVDLGYELHQASTFNVTGSFYNFSNIRYGAPPVGDLRFRAPIAPTTNRSVVQTGDVGRICYQAFPPWFSVAGSWIADYLTDQPLNLSALAAQVNAYNATQSASTVAAQDPRATEDCLFLDVMVPESIFANAGKGSGAPVMVWIYGGGYTLGHKSAQGTPAGILQRSEDGGSEGVIYVAMNYRLGAFGWLSGPDLQADGTANAGLYDQRLALEWVQEHITKFGGDPERVSVFGESAGGGSIMHQITAFGGLNGPAPFAQAIMQSPGFAPVATNYAEQSTFNRLLELTGATDLAALRALPVAELVVANSIQVDEAMYGGFAYGPVVDGVFAPALPGKLLLQGSFDKTVRVMTGHNSDEGLLFTSPFVQSQADFVAYLELFLPGIQAGALAYISQTLYPPVFDGSMPYTDYISRTALFVSEIVFTCNTNYLARAYGNETYGYFFTVPPGLHGMDIPYTYFNGPSASVTNSTVAIVLQDYLTSFSETGVPVAPNTPAFTMYGTEAMVQELGNAGIRRVPDTTNNERCYWLQKALFA